MHLNRDQRLAREDATRSPLKFPLKKNIIGRMLLTYCMIDDKRLAPELAR